VLNVFRMFSKMTGQRLAVESNHEVPLDAILRMAFAAGPMYRL
jgi:hypothetical protein